jgi:cell division protein FtsZ
MGTGEASGEGRAMAAAEAAIANPLLDETSMRGAKGLLISITGGRDMTLFEVDEAATRIREEVDPEANIILGATFDEGLEGVIRVSVVATGIDKQIGDAAPAPLEFRQPVKQPTSQAKPMAPHGALRPPVVEQPRQVDPIAQAIQSAEVDMPIAAAPAAPAASAEPDFRPQSRIFQAPAPEAFERAPVARAPMPQAQATQPQAYQQPQQMHAEPAPRPAPRMPAVSDFPPVAQAEIAARRAPQQPQPAQEEPRGPMSLLKRLTHGLSRREEEQPAARLEPAQHREPGMRPAERRPMQQDGSIYAPRRGQLDDQGRPQPRAASEDDQLEIPAFLRRQSN